MDSLELSHADSQKYYYFLIRRFFRGKGITYWIAYFVSQNTNVA